MSKRVIGFHYTLTNTKGDVVDSSIGREPLYFLEGSGHIIAGLESELVSMKVGQKGKVEVKSADAYGPRRDDLVVKVQKSQFPDNGANLNVGDLFQINEDPHSPPFEIISMNGDEIMMDGNHPLAGQDLFFDVEIAKIREATESELTHGHAHGETGEGHHH